MASVAPKFEVVHNDEPAPTGEAVSDAMSDVSIEPVPRAEALRLLEALLFAAGEPLDEATRAKGLPEGVNVNESREQLQAIERIERERIGLAAKAARVDAAKKALDEAKALNLSAKERAKASQSTCGRATIWAL